MSSSVPRAIKAGLTVLSVLGLLLWSAATFLGLYFFTVGSAGLSVPLALCFGCLMSLTLFLMCRYTRKAIGGYRAQSARKLQWVFFSLYMLITAGTFIFVLHSVAVSTTIKNGCRTAALEDLSGLYALVDSRAPDGSYPEYVNSQVKRYETGNGHKSAGTLGFECEQLREMLTKKSGYTRLHDEIAAYWQEADHTVRNWNLYYLPSTAATFRDRHTVWTDSLALCSKKGNTGIYTTLHQPYRAKYRPKADLYNSFTSVTSYDFSVPGILLVLILQALILGVWLIIFKENKSYRAVGITGEDADKSIWNSSSAWSPSD